MCNHTFTYWSVVPPTHCPICGACLGCGSPAPLQPHPQPVHPYVPPRWPYPGRPIYTTTPNITC